MYNNNNIKLYVIDLVIMNKMLGIIPVCHKLIENQFPDELDSVNLTGIFVSNINNICLTKKKREHQNTENILNTFNEIYKADLDMNNCRKIIDYGIIDNIHIYIILVTNKEDITSATLFNTIDKDKEVYCWKIFFDRFKNICQSNKENKNSDIYKNILLPQEKYSNENLTHTLHCGKYKIDISLKEIYTKLSECE